jgi:hypothetical protein
MVTAYINLTNSLDTNQDVRSKDYYLTHSNATMSFPYNLVVYCDQNSLEQLKQLRPPHLSGRTQYIIVDFEQLKFIGHPGYEDKTFSHYRDQIISNRLKKPYQFDPRNNASYYLFCMARYLLLKRTIEENPFASSHFCWINICIERMGYKNLIHLDEAFSVNRDKFSTCYIDYQPQSLVDNVHEYFRMGRCGMCSGFFTGHKKYMKHVCHEIESQFLSYLDKGYGHADEQLYSPVYFKYPDYFEHYYGDYLQMITNYCYIYENPSTPINKFIIHSFGYQNYEKCYEACQYVWKSYVNKKCQMTVDELKNLCFYEKMCQNYLSDPQSLIQVSNQPQAPKAKQSTIITLLYNVGNPSHISDMLGNIHHWLKITFPVIIWTDSICYPVLQMLFFNKKNVLIKKKEISEFSTYQYKDKVDQLQTTYEIKNRNITKDTLLYHMLMYARPYMWKESIEENPFNTETFICMDFGLYRFTKDINVVEQWKIEDKLKLLMIRPYLASDLVPKEYFRWTRHNIAGGMLTGHKDNILRYVILFEEELQNMLADQWYQLDEAITTIIVRKYPDLFNYYYGDYTGIIDNYETVHNLTNVPETIQYYLNNRLFSEAQQVINMLDYRYSSKTLYYFVEYSLLTNYYSMGGKLNTLVKDLLNDPKYIELRTVVEERHKTNLSFYK